MMTRVRHAFRSMLTVIAAVALSGCGSVRYPAHYLLEVAPALPAATPARPPLGPLVLRELACPPYLCDGRVVYREKPHEVGFYEFHRWAISPRTALTRVVADRIRAASLFESVTVQSRPARAAYLLRGEIAGLEEVDEPAAVLAVCAISAEMVDVKTGAVVWTGTFSERVAAKQPNVAGVVAALAVSAGAVADRLVESIAGEVAGRRAP